MNSKREVIYAYKISGFEDTFYCPTMCSLSNMNVGDYTISNPTNASEVYGILKVTPAIDMKITYIGVELDIPLPAIFFHAHRTKQVILAFTTRIATVDKECFSIFGQKITSVVKQKNQHVVLQFADKIPRDAFLSYDPSSPGCTNKLRNSTD